VTGLLAEDVESRRCCQYGHQVTEWLPVSWPDDDAAAVALEDWLDEGAADFTGLDFRGADLTGAPLSGAVLLGADLRGVVLCRAELDSAQLTSADLRGADLTHARLADANLDAADLAAASLAGANLTRVTAIGAVFTDTNLRGANLTAAMLDDVDLTSADLTDAVLDGAFLPRRAKRIDVYADATTRDEQCRLLHGGEPFTGELVREHGDRLLSLETYRDGIGVGPSRTWYDSGILRDERGGDSVKRWHPNGMPAEDGDELWDGRGEPTTRVDRTRTTEVDGLLHVDGTLFTGQVADGGRVTSYRDGLADGPWWASDAEGRHDQGVRVGEWRRWYPNGRLRELTAYDPAGAVRLTQRWSDGGFLIDEREVPADEPPPARIDLQVDTVEWDDGARLRHDGSVFTGEAVIHGYSGEVISLVTYRYGVEDGPRREWYEDGTPKSELVVRRGKVVGVARDWHPDGRLARERTFDEHGNPASERRFA
jgi:antitoxin component YwqK of YwqJK toxin-antitoxin module